MTKGRKFFSLITLMFAIVAMTTFVSAQEKSDSDAPKREMKRDGQFGKRNFGEGKHGKRGMRGHGGGNIMRMVRGLDLTDAQKTQIKTLMETNRTAMQPSFEEARSLHMKKRDGSITETEQARLEQIKTEMKASSEQLRLTVLGLLTPEQNAKLEQMKAEREQRMQERKQRWQERKQQKESAPANKPLS